MNHSVYQAATNWAEELPTSNRSPSVIFSVTSASPRRLFPHHQSAPVIPVPAAPRHLLPVLPISCSETASCCCVERTPPVWIAAQTLLPAAIISIKPSAQSSSPPQLRPSWGGMWRYIHTLYYTILYIYIPP